MKFNKILIFSSYTYFMLFFFFSTISTNGLNKRIKYLNKHKDNRLNEEQRNFLKIVETLKSSLIEQGSSFEKIGIKFINENNRFVIAEEDIPKDKIIIKIPFKILLHYRNPKIKAFCDSFKNEKLFGVTSSSQQFNCLVIFILFQMKNPDPKFKAYIESIPKSFEEYPIFFSKEEKEIIKNSLLEESILDFESYIDELKNFIDSTEHKGKFNYKDFVHASISVGSRNFGITDEHSKIEFHVMAPYTDLFNYSPDYNTYWPRKIKNSKGFFELTATKEIKKGEQIFLNYGDDDNEKLLVDYGFTLENNPNPIENEYFTIMKDGKKTLTTLCFKTPKCLIKISEEYNKNKGNKEEIRNQEIKFLEKILQDLKKYSNKNRLEEVKKRLNETSNMKNIYRALVSEDKLITRNKIYANEMIKILKGGKDSLDENKKLKLYKEEKKYFEKFF